MDQAGGAAHLGALQEVEGRPACLRVAAPRVLPPLCDTRGPQVVAQGHLKGVLHFRCFPSVRNCLLVSPSSTSLSVGHPPLHPLPPYFVV